MDNVALVTQLQELGAGAASAMGSRSQLRDVSDPVTWVYCYLSFVAVLCSCWPTIRSSSSWRGPMEERGGSLGSASRWPQGHHLAGPKSTYCSSPLLSWVWPQARAVVTALCLSLDHSRADCALASLVPQSVEGRRAPFLQRPYSEYCHRFNSGSCPNTSESSQFLYTCSTCAKAGHPASDCKESKGKSKAPVA